MAIEESSFDPWQLQEIHSLFFEVFRSAKGPTELHIQLFVGVLSLVKGGRIVKLPTHP
jgi:hypothetical protein